MWRTFCLIGTTCTTTISVPGAVSFATMPASLCLLCMPLSYRLFLLFSCGNSYLLSFRYVFFIVKKWLSVELWSSLLHYSRNLSNLNLGGEISPAVGDLRNLQCMYVFVSSLFFFFNKKIILFDLVTFNFNDILRSVVFVTMAGTCRETSFLVKSRMKLATVPPWFICMIPHFLWCLASRVCIRMLESSSEVTCWH